MKLLLSQRFWTVWVLVVGGVHLVLAGVSRVVGRKPDPSFISLMPFLAFAGVYAILSQTEKS